MSIMDYLFNAVKFFVTSQQLYFLEEKLNEKSKKQRSGSYRS